MVAFLTPDWFRARWNEARSRAGKRYTPELNVSLPIAGHFECASQDGSLFERFSDTSAALQKARSRLDHVLSSHLSADKISRLTAATTTLQQQIDDLVNGRQHAPTILQVTPALATTTALRKEIDQPLMDLRRKSAQERRQSTAEVAIEDLQRLSGVLRRIDDELDCSEIFLVNSPYMLLLGGAGTGKTHLLCEMTRERIDRATPALLFMGQAFQTPFTDPIQSLTDSVAPGAPGEDFLGSLNEYGRQRSVRCLISIDAINEGHRDSWKVAVPALVAACRRYPAIALVISCRNPFDKLLVPDPNQLGLHVVTHYGFPPEQQTDAITTYFKGYGIPIPEVPLLEEEFSNPLFLKLFCEAIEKVTARQQHNQIKSLTSGQRGMTHILEYFVKQKDGILSQQLGIKSGLTWKFLKNHFAAALAEGHKQYLSLTQARVLADAVQPSGMAPGALLQALLNEDLLAEDISFTGSQPEEIVRFTYQKFSDHLIARHLLGTQLDPSSSKTIAASLKDPRRLGSYFTDQDSVLGNINIIEALMVEFPTRVQNSGELLDFLGWKSFPIALAEALIRGLYWRDPQHSINASTERMITAFLKHKDLREQTLNALTALAVKPSHPFNVSRIDRFLTRLSMSQRDLFWTEYLRRSMGNEGTPERLLIWAEHSAKAPSRTFTEAYVTLFKWFLTSTQRRFRDRATHVLFRLGLAYPEVLFAATLNSLSANDPYVRERMLAASYGVAMARWRSPLFREFQSRTLPQYARALFKGMFARGAKAATTHILSRDYAERTIELATKIQPRLLSAAARALVTPPFRSGGIRRWKESSDRDVGKYRNGDAPIQMDFANYTIGGLVPGRGNYDDKHQEYQRVKRQIFWRIYNLGYTLEAFSSIDEEIARIGWHQASRNGEAGKTERYGKKYAWIAFYELAGYRQDLGRLDRDDTRIPDADIDPSFPEIGEWARVFERWIDESVPLKAWIRGGYKPAIEDRLVMPSIAEIHGPWVIIHGFANQLQGDKKLSAIFSGLLVRSRDLPIAQRILRAVDSPGSHDFPRAEDEHYTYAGEIPWANTWRERQDPARISDGIDEIEVFVPTRDYSWESHHSQENQLSSISFPSKELAEALGVYVRIPDISLDELRSGHPALIPIVSGEPFYDYESILVIRQNLLDQYLKRNDLGLVLLVWGERRANYHQFEDTHSAEGSFELWEILHKQGFIYEAGGFTRFC